MRKFAWGLGLAMIVVSLCWAAVIVIAFMVEVTQNPKPFSFFIIQHFPNFVVFLLVGILLFHMGHDQHPKYPH